MSRYGEFRAEIGDGRLTLTHITKPFRRKIQIKITWNQFKLNIKDGRLPVAYQYCELPEDIQISRPNTVRDPSRPRDFEIIKIVAAPGVNIYTSGFRIGDERPSLIMPYIIIIRVQDMLSIPPLGIDCQTTFLLGEYTVPHPGKILFIRRAIEEGGSALRVFVDENVFTVFHKSNGVMIRHWNTLQDLHLVVPLHTSDSSSKFAYHFNTYGKLDNRGDKPLLEVVATTSVDVFISRAPRMVKTVGSTSASGDAVFLKLYNVSDISQVPSQGAEFRRSHDWREIKTNMIQIRQNISLSFDVEIADLVFRSIPVLGDLIDGFEFVSGLEHGRDLYGRPLSSSDLTFLGASVLVGVIQVGPNLSSIKKLLSRFGRRKANLSKFLAATKNTNFSKTEIQNFDTVFELARNGSAIPFHRMDLYSESLLKIVPPKRQIGDLLNVHGDGFIDFELQSGFQNYVSRNRKKGSSFSEPIEWARRQTVGKFNRRLAVLLGEGFREDLAKSGQLIKLDNFVNVKDVPEPVGYLKGGLRKDFELLVSEPNFPRFVAAFGEILPKSMRRVDFNSFLKADIKNLRVSRDLLNRVKGHVGEILSESEQVDILRRYAKEHEDTILINGTYIERWENNEKLLQGPKQYLDGIFVRPQKRQLAVAGKVEVKAGGRGGAEAGRQYFDWHEGRLTHGDGSRVIVPVGAKITYLDKGRISTRVTKKERRFVYKPNKQNGGLRETEIVNLLSSDNHIVVAGGTSHLGLAGNHRTVGQEVRVTLKRERIRSEDTAVVVQGKPIVMEDVTSAELDFLAARIVGVFGKL